MAELGKKKRVLDRAEKELEQALRDCRWLTEKPKKAKKLTVTETVREPLSGRKKSKYPYRPRFSGAVSKLPSNLPSTSSASSSSNSDFQHGKLTLILIIFYLNVTLYFSP